MADKKVFDPLAWASQNNANGAANSANLVSNNEPKPVAAAPADNTPTAAAPKGNELERARAAVAELERLGGNIADSYNDWWECGCALAALGPDGRELFHRVSALSAKYREAQCEKQWQECLAKRDGRITLATFYDMAKRAGVDLSDIARRYPSKEKISKYQKSHGCENGARQASDGASKAGKMINNQNITPNSVPAGAPCANEADSRETSEILRFSFRRTFSQFIDPERLPVTIRRTLEGLETDEERDKVLLADLTLLGAAQPNVYGIYGGKVVYTPFYLFLLGLAGISHKGIIDDVRQLLWHIEDAMRRRYYAELDDYKQQHAEWEERRHQRGKLKTEAGPEPEEPAYRTLFIAADNSAAGIKLDLYNNGGRGIIFSTEADTLTQVLGQEWGQFTDVLRQAFHHESIESTRTTDKRHIVIQEPQLAMLVTCTPRQITYLLSTKQQENGSSSRDLFYCLQGSTEWRDPFRSQKALADHYREIGLTVKQMYDLLYQRTGSRIQIVLTDSQQQRFNDHFRPLLPEHIGLYGIEFSAFIVRIALVAFRMMMVLTTLRNFEHDRLADPQQQAFACCDDDFETAMTIIDCLVAHTAYVYTTLLCPGDESQQAVQPLNGKERQLYQSLPTAFTTQQFDQIAATLGIAHSSGRRYLGNLISRYQLIERTSQGNYTKLNKGQ